MIKQRHTVCGIVCWSHDSPVSKVVWYGIANQDSVQGGASIVAGLWTEQPRNCGLIPIP
jgi:hypothetical protein